MYTINVYPNGQILQEIWAKVKHYQKQVLKLQPIRDVTNIGYQVSVLVTNNVTNMPHMNSG